MIRNESQEDYLEAILKLKDKLSVVKSIDVANELGFSKPSVSVAMRKLKEKGLIIVDDDGGLILTDEGYSIANKTLEKHDFLTKWFIDIGVEPKLAEEEACQIEHSITDDTFTKIKKYLKNK